MIFFRRSEHYLLKSKLCLIITKFSKITNVVFAVTNQNDSIRNEKSKNTTIATFKNGWRYQLNLKFPKKTQIMLIHTTSRARKVDRQWHCDYTK